MTSAGTARPHPSENVRTACSLWGEAAVVRRCASLLLAPSLSDPELLVLLGGAHARLILDGRDRDYWIPVWAARALLYAWDPSAALAVVSGLGHSAWRVREMSAKVCLRREIGEAADSLALLASDAIPRVRVAAARALGAVGESEHAPPLISLLTDPEPAVRLAASQSLRQLSVRLDRDFRP